MSASTIVTGGFGSFGSVNLIPTAGFSVGIVTVPDSEGLEYRGKPNKLHYRHTQNKLHYRHDGNRLHYRAKKE